jgi:hypothetical protein
MTATGTPEKTPPGPPPAPVKPVSFTLTFEKTQVRNTEETKVVRAEVTKQARAAASSKDLLSIAARATAGADTLLNVIDYAELSASPDGNGNSTIFKTNKVIEDRVTFLRDHCDRFDMSFIMKNFPILDDSSSEADRNTGRTIDLFANWDKIGSDKEITLDQIAKTTEWIKKFASATNEIFLEDLDWINRHLRNSVTVELEERISSKLKNKYTNTAYHGGPLTFAIIIEECISASEHAEVQKKKLHVSQSIYRALTNKTKMDKVKLEWVAEYYGFETPICIAVTTGKIVRQCAKVLKNGGFYDAENDPKFKDALNMVPAGGNHTKYLKETLFKIFFPHSKDLPQLNSRGNLI